MGRADMDGMAAAPAVAEPVGGRSLHDAVVDRVREMILDGELPAGGRVPEQALCARLGVSRTPLREAFKVLASEGLLELRPNRGARVTRLTRRDVEEMFEVMGALESLAGELACRKASDAQIAEVRAVHYEMLAQHARGDLGAYFRLNQEIHRRILEAADNATLAAAAEGLGARIRRARYQANLSRERWDRAVVEHGEILAALEARDGPRLAALLKAHLANKCVVVIAAIEAEAREGPGRPG
ncbi:MAG: GntR family transcriptional regulator [Alphaproteobacteria bacterium]